MICFPSSPSQTCWSWSRSWLLCLERSLQCFLVLLLPPATPLTRQQAHQPVSAHLCWFLQIIILTFQRDCCPALFAHKLCILLFILLTNKFTWAVNLLHFTLLDSLILKVFFNYSCSVSLRICVSLWVLEGKKQVCIITHSKTQAKPEHSQTPSKQPVSCQHSKIDLQSDYSNSFVSQLFSF